MSAAYDRTFHFYYFNFFKINIMVGYNYKLLSLHQNFHKMQHYTGFLDKLTVRIGRVRVEQ